MSLMDALARVAVAMNESNRAPVPPMPKARPPEPERKPGAGAAGAGFGAGPRPATNPKPSPRPVPAAQAGGFGELLGQVLKGGAAPGGRSGGLGGALDELSRLSRPAAGATPKPAGGSFGDRLNDRLADRPLPEPRAEDEDLARLLLRAMLTAAKADGRLDRDERGRIMARLGSPDRATMEFLTAEMDRPADMPALVSATPVGAEAQVYLVSLMALDLDTRPEAQYLHALAQALRLTPAEVNSIHARIGAPPLYR